MGKSKPLEPAGQITHDRGSLLVSSANFIHVIWDLREKKRDVGHGTGRFKEMKEAW